MFYMDCDPNSFAERFFEEKFLIWPEVCLERAVLRCQHFTLHAARLLQEMVLSGSLWRY